MISKPRVLTAGITRGRLYEGPYWSPAHECLWWTDIAAQTVFCRSESTGAIRQFPMAEKVSAVVETAESLLLITGRRNLWVMDPVSGGHTSLLELSDEPHGNRCNDAKCDPYGNLWFGTMDEAEIFNSGTLWCLTKSGQLLRFFDGIGISNTLAWDTARQRMYFADSKAATIFVMDFRLVDEVPELGPRQVFAGPGAAPGGPDGSALDNQGHLWNARWDGGCVVNFDQEGRVCGVVDVGAKRPTSCAFVGSCLQTLVVTTAAVGLGDLPIDSLDGHVLALNVGASGQPVPAYGGAGFVRLASLRQESLGRT